MGICCCLRVLVQAFVLFEGAGAGVGPCRC